MAYQVLDNTPSLGYIAWSGVHIVYKGVDYAVADGNTNKKYVWWDYTYPTLFQTSDALPVLTDDDVLVFFNKNGTHLTVPKATVVDGGLIVSESILADALAANSVTGVKIQAGSISADKIAAGAVGAEKIAAGSIASEHIAAAGITADKITSGRLLAGLVEVVSQDGLARFLGDGFRVYSNNGELRAHLGYYESLGTQTATFTRSSVAYLSTGTQVAANAPRYETGKFAQAWFGEEGTRNLWVYSDPTALSQLDVYGNVSIATAGSVDARFSGGVVFGDNSVTRYAYKTPSLTASTTYSVSAFIKMNDGSQPVPGTDFRFVLAGVAFTPTNVKLVTGTLYRVWGSYSTPSSITSYNTGVVKYTGSSAKGFSVSGFQVEQKAYATSYMPTSGASATRSAETLTIPTAGVFPDTNNFSIELWAKTQVVKTDTYQGIFGGRGIPGAPPVDLMIATNNQLMFFYLDSAGTNTSLPTGYYISNRTNWHYYAVAFNNGLVRIYVDGAKVKEANITLRQYTGSGNFYVGRSIVAAECWNGLIDDLRISSRARTDAEFSAAYSSNAPLPVDEYTTYLMRFDGNLLPSVREDYGLMINKGKIEADVIVAGQYASKLGKTPATVIVADGSTTQDVKRADFVVPVGSTSAEDTINQAINSLPLGGGQVLLMEGTYIVDGPINVPSNVTLAGQGANTVIKIKDALNTDIHVIQNADWTNGNTKIALRDFAIDGNKANNTSGSQYGVYLYKTTYSLVMRLLINDCRSSSILLDNSNSNTITGNACQRNYNGIGLYSSSNNNVVTGNICQGSGNFGIYLYISSDNAVTGNTCQGSVYGIYLYSSLNNTVTGNTCQGNSMHGIRLDTSSNNAVTGNTCQGNGYHGIFLFHQTSYNTVVGNICLENSQAANATYNNIQIDFNADYNNVQANICRVGALTNKPRYGIFIASADCDGNMVTNNDLYQGGATAAFSDAGTGTITTAGNRLA